MDHSLLHQISTSGQHLFHDLSCVFFSQFFLLLNVLMKIAMRTILHYNVVEVRSLDNLVQPDNILMHQILVNLDLSFQHLQIRSSELFQFNDLDGIPLVVSFNLDSFIDIT